MNDLIKRFKEYLQLSGYAKKEYTILYQFFFKIATFLQYNSLEEIAEEELRQYWLGCQS